MTHKLKHYDKPVNPELYSKIEVMENPGNRKIKPLSKEEFKMGCNGIIYMDITTNQIVFDEERNKKIHTVAIA